MCFLSLLEQATHNIAEARYYNPAIFLANGGVM
jgi:hypothetical protein